MSFLGGGGGGGGGVAYDKLLLTVDTTTENFRYVASHIP